MNTESIPKAVYPVDLHTHTNRSDGTDTPAELIQHGAAAGLKILAMTDHDITPPKRIQIPGQDTPLSPEAYAKTLGLTLIPGTEISCETELEDVHLVCLGCNWDAPYFDGLAADMIASKIEGYGKLLQALTASGYPITWDELLSSAPAPISREQVQKKMIFELMAKKGFTENWQTAKLMIKNQPEFQVKRRKPDPRQVIEQIHQAGGIVILAHPYLISLPDEDRAAYIDTLIEAGLDGIEACYTYDKTSYGGGLLPEQIESRIRRDYEDRLAVISGGSDYHNDGRKGVKNPRQLGERGLSLRAFYQNPLLSALLPQTS